MSGGEFLSSLELPSDTLRSPGHLVVIDQIGQGIDAQFATHFLLRDFVLQGQQSQVQGQGQSEDVGQPWNVVLVTTIQTGRHWSDIATKLGWNFGAMQKQGNLHLIDLIEEEWNRLSIAEAAKTNANDDSKDDKVKVTKDDDDLFSRISNALTLTSTNSYSSNHNHPDGTTGHSLIIIEDLTALLYNGGGCGSGQMTERSLVEFIFKLKRLAKSRNATLLTLVHSSKDDGDLEGGRVAGLVAQNYADICLNISPLGTGASSQITGHLQVKYHPKEYTNVNKKCSQYGGGRRSRLAQYKLDERNVRVNFIPGV